MSKILKMMGFNQVARLQKESRDILGIFEKIINRTDEVNNKIQEALNVREDKILSLKFEVGDLEASKLKNSKLSEKLHAFLYDVD